MSDTEEEDIESMSKAIQLELLPVKSRKKYEDCYHTFMAWMDEKKMYEINENVLLVYFDYLYNAQKYAPSTLWSKWSMLRSTINLYKNVNIEPYVLLKALLKQKSKNYEPKQAKVFRPEEIQDFLEKAEDKIHLVNKVN